MTLIDDVLDKAIADNKVPGLVAMAANRDGVFYDRAVGIMGVDKDTAMQSNAIHRIFSMTKAIGTLAAVKLVEEGALSLDTTVSSIFPEFAKLQVLDGFDGDTPRLRPPSSEATIRHLATHTSGLEFEVWSDKMSHYLEVTDHPSIRTGVLKSLNYPLSFDPGTSWSYGPSIDWLGRVVEEVSGKRIDEYCRQFLFDPLEMTDTIFECDGQYRNRLVSVHSRNKNGELEVIELEPPLEPEFYGMGRALYSTAPDYMRFLRMLLGKGELDGVRIFQSDTVAMICENHMGELNMRKMVTAMPSASKDLDFFPGVRKKWGLGFMFNEENIPDMRSAGTQSWAGLLNTHMWWDPEKDIAGVIFMQHLPFLDETAMQIYADFERAVYASI